MPYITLQVLNMKPPEILSMLEEAAGTRMYENKKEAALKTLEKKQIKVEEINKVSRSIQESCFRTYCQYILSHHAIVKAVAMISNVLSLLQEKVPP